MKHITWIIAFIVMAILASGPCLALDLKGLTGIEYGAWDSDEDEGGGQLFIPVEISGTLSDFSFKLLTAYAYTNYEDSPELDDSVSGVTDTKLGLTYEMKDKLPVALLFGLDLNLPTGQTGLDDNLLTFIRDPDLYAISNLGKGYHINPTLSIAKGWGDFQAGFGLGYVWRGEYDYSESTTDYDPGDIFNIVVELDYEITSHWKMRFFGENAWYGKNEKEGNDFSQNGDFLMLGCNFQYMQPKWDAWLGVTSIFRNKNQFLETGTGTALVTEEHNSFGDEWNVQLGLRYRLNEQTALNAAFQYMNVQENDYPEGDILYNGARIKYSLQLGMAYAFLPDLTANLNLKGFSMEDDPNWYHPDEERSYQGYSIGIYAAKMF